MSEAQLRGRWENLSLTYVTGVSFSPSRPIQRFSSAIINHHHMGLGSFPSSAPSLQAEQLPPPCW